MAARERDQDLCGDAPSALPAEDEKNVRRLIDSIADDLERSIANLGHPVGCGVAPHPDACQAAAERFIDKIGPVALSVLAVRAALSSATGSEAPGGQT